MIFFYLRHCKIIDKFTLNLQYTCTSVAYAPKGATRKHTHMLLADNDTVPI